MTRPEKKSPAFPDFRQDHHKEILLVLIACTLLPLCGLPVLVMHQVPFSVQDMIAGLWLCVYLLNRLEAWSSAELIPRDTKLLPEFLKGISLGVVLVVIAVLCTLFFSLTGSPGSGGRPSGMGQAFLPLVIGNLLVWAVFEELCYRFLVPDGLNQLGLPRGPALASSVILFGLAHIQSGPLNFCQALACGLVLTFARERWNSLVIVAIAHGAYNLTVFLALG